MAISVDTCVFHELLLKNYGTAQGQVDSHTCVFTQDSKIL